jgi:hypothetical protein
LTQRNKPTNKTAAALAAIAGLQSGKSKQAPGATPKEPQVDELATMGQWRAHVLKVLAGPPWGLDAGVDFAADAPEIHEVASLLFYFDSFRRHIAPEVKRHHGKLAERLMRLSWAAGELLTVLEIVDQSPTLRALLQGALCQLGSIEQAPALLIRPSCLEHTELEQLLHTLKESADLAIPDAEALQLKRGAQEDPALLQAVTQLCPHLRRLTHRVMVESGADPKKCLANEKAELAECLAGLLAPAGGPSAGRLRNILSDHTKNPPPTL